MSEFEGKKVVTPTGIERTFKDSELIVSRTDTKGRIIYANRLFMSLAGFEEGDLLGIPHSLVRHPDMPRCVFKLLWETIGAGKEIFAYVKNMSRNGDHYWVFAHVTPIFDGGNNIIGYHSNRRRPNSSTVREVIEPLYARLLSEESKYGSRRESIAASTDVLVKILQEKGCTYDKLMFSI